MDGRILRKLLFTLVMMALTLAPAPSPAQKDPDSVVSQMSSSKTWIENAASTPDLSTLVTALKAAGLYGTFDGPGPFTVFAPTNQAFSKLPAGTMDRLLKPDEKAILARLLTYHIVPGKITSRQLLRLVHRGGGKATLTTVQGKELTVTSSDDTLILVDAKGNMATVTTTDVSQSNGALYLIDTVLLP